MINIQQVLAATVALVFLFASTSCNGKQSAEIRVAELGESSCAQDTSGAANSIKVQLMRLKESTSIDDGETLGVELGQAYEAHSCEFIDQAIRAELTDKQIASLISMMPVELVDRPCESQKQLQSRLRSLDKAPFNVERIAAIKRFLQKSLDRDGRMCARSNSKQ